MKRLLTAILLATPILLSLPAEPVRGEEGAGDAYPEKSEILRTFLNPHEQISDEGEILWNKCLICHPTVPSVNARDIRQVEIRYEDDIKQLCYRCHPNRIHPGGGWINVALGKGTGAPNHLVRPPKNILMGRRLSLKEYSTILPLEPKSGKVFCATCHNPHERGLLKKKADVGGDATFRLRSEETSICQLCHRR